MSLLVHPSMAGHMILALGGSVSVIMGGVALLIDAAEEVAYIETSPGFDMRALTSIELIAHRCGFEVIGEDEAPAEEFEDGRVRHWLAQRWFPEMQEGEVAVAS